MKESKIASIRPSPLASIVGIAAGIIFLAFGLLLMSAGHGTDTGGQGFVGMFMVIWVVLCIGIIVYNVRNLASYSGTEKGEIPLTAEEVVELAPGPEAAAAGDFEVRLRNLEALRRDGLINEEEFQKKRREIMDEKW